MYVLYARRKLEITLMLDIKRRCFFFVLFLKQTKDCLQKNDIRETEKKKKDHIDL